MRHRNRTIGAALVVGALAVTVAACGSSSSSSAATTGNSGTTAASSNTASASDPVVFDANAKTAAVFVVAGQSGGLNFDGKQNGGLSITVPAGWKVTITCRNDGNLPHSCAIVDPTSQAIALTGASTPDPTTGFNPGSAESFSFAASTPGSYRLACLVPGHEDGGMWATFTVSSSTTTPQLHT